MIEINQLNNTYLQVNTDDDDILFEIHNHFSLFIDGYQFSPKYKSNVWNGKIDYFKKGSQTLYVGLLSILEKLLKKYKKEYQINLLKNIDLNVSEDELKKFISKLNIPKDFEQRDYQINYILKSLNNKRLINISPTASGKSFMIYILLKYLMEKIEGNILVVVPNSYLSEQLYRDFQAYGWSNISEYCHRIYHGMEKDYTKKITISTWQTIQTLEKNDIKDFLYNMDCILVDEVHKLKSTKAIKYVLENSVNAYLRFGFTGTVDFKCKADEFLFSGLIGPLNEMVSIKELQDIDKISNLEIECHLLKYPKTQILKYDREIEKIQKSENRKKELVNIIKTLENNTLILFGKKIEYGKDLLKFLQKNFPNKEFHYIDGNVPINQRLIIVDRMEKNKNIILIANYPVFSTGINLKNLYNIVFWTPLKSKITVAQSIGRGLRKFENKILKLIDICDILNETPYQYNYTLKHAISRMKLYEKNKFKIKIFKKKLDFL